MSPFDDNFAKMVSIQKDAAISALNVAIKADESRFRVQSEAAITVILDEVRQLKAQKAQPALEA